MTSFTRHTAAAHPTLTAPIGYEPQGLSTKPVPTRADTSRPKRNRQDRLLEETHRLLNEHCLHCITPEGAHLLVDTADGLAYPLEAEVVVNRVKRMALQEAGINVSRSVIQSAIDIIRAEEPCQIDIGYGRTVMDRNGNLFLLTADGVLVVPFGQTGYQLPQQRPRVAFLLPTNALSSQYKPLYGTASGYGDLRHLFNVLNVPEDRELLVIAWMISCLLPESRKCLLEIVGEPQSGKSTLQASLKQILDPSCMPLVKNPPETSLQVNNLAKSDHVICIDGVETLKPRVQSELVEVMRGKMIETPLLRKKYKTKIHLSRPFMLNSLESVVTERDLADRTLTVDLPPIDSNKYRIDFFRSTELQTIFPGAYASLIHLLSNISHRWKHHSLTGFFPSGLEDICRIGCSVAEAFGLGYQEFIDQFQKCQKRRYTLEMSENPVAFAIYSLIKESGDSCQEVSTGQLLSTLEKNFPDLTNDEKWPKNVRQFGHAIRASMPLLRAYHIQITQLPKRGGLYRLRFSTLSPSTPHTPAQLGEYQLNEGGSFSRR